MICTAEGFGAEFLEQILLCLFSSWLLSLKRLIDVLTPTASWRSRLASANVCQLLLESCLREIHIRRPSDFLCAGEAGLAVVCNREEISRKEMRGTSCFWLKPTLNLAVV